MASAPNCRKSYETMSSLKVSAGSAEAFMILLWGQKQQRNVVSLPRRYCSRDTYFRSGAEASSTAHRIFSSLEAATLASTSAATCPCIVSSAHLFAFLLSTLTRQSAVTSSTLSCETSPTISRFRNVARNVAMTSSKAVMLKKLSSAKGGACDAARRWRTAIQETLRAAIPLPCFQQ